MATCPNCSKPLWGDGSDLLKCPSCGAYLLKKRSYRPDLQTEPLVPNSYLGAVLIAVFLVSVLILGPSVKNATCSLSWFARTVDIVLYDIENGTTQYLGKEICMESYHESFTISENIVAWFSSSEGHEISIYNLETRKQTKIKTHGFIQDFRSYKDVIYYTSYYHNSHLTIYNTSSGIEKTIGNPDDNVNRKSLDISDTYMLFRDGYKNITLYNLKTDEKQFLGKGTFGIINDEHAAVVIKNETQRYVLRYYDLSNLSYIKLDDSSSIFRFLHYNDNTIIRPKANNTIALYDTELHRYNLSNETYVGYQDSSQVFYNLTGKYQYDAFVKNGAPEYGDIYLRNFETQEVKQITDTEDRDEYRPMQNSRYIVWGALHEVKNPCMSLCLIPLIGIGCIYIFFRNYKISKMTELCEKNSRRDVPR